MMRRTVLCLALVLAGCSPSPVSLEPAKLPLGFIARQVVTPSSGQVFESGDAIAGGRLTIKAVKAGTGEPIGDVKVTVIGPTLASGTTSSTLDLAFEPLRAGSYQVRLEAPGYVTELHTGIVLDPTNPTTVRYELTASGGDVTGHALDGSGTPLAGAWVSHGEAYAFTDGNGAFRLKGLPTGTQELAISKTGFAPSAVSATVTGNESSVGDVRLASRTRSVYFANAGQTFGNGTVGSALSALRTALGGNGFSIQDSPSDPAIQVVASPTAGGVGDVAAKAESLRSFVAAGGKLILLGEWGGFADYNPDVINQLAQPYGIAFNPDLVRLNGTSHPAWIQIPSVSNALPAMPAVPTISSGIQLFESCSLMAPTPAVPLASTGSGGFRVTALINGDFVVAAARPYGRGLVAAVGDTSAWAAPATQATGASNLEAASNQAFILDLFGW